MDIRFNHSQPTGASRRTSRPGTAKRASVNAASLSTESDAYDSKFFNELIDHLSQIPDKREAFMLEGRELLNSPNYPNEKHLKDLEETLALHRVGNPDADF